jgi:hypothetical protein
MESADLIRVLSNLKHRADSKKTTSSFSWTAISKIYQNISGQELDYDSFKSQFDSDAKIKNLIKSFNRYGVVLNTDEQEMPTEFGQKPKSNNAGALRAADKILQQPG